MTTLFLRSLCLISILALSACGSLPRGAALQQEILKADANETDPGFQLVAVTSESVQKLAAWPSTGWHGHYHWISTSRGPASNTIQAGDRIDLTIWDSQVNSLITGQGSNVVQISGVTVSPTGTIFVPYADEVRVRGLTPNDARRKVQEMLEPVAPDAQVQLNLSAGSKNSISVVAGVGAPGTYPLPDRNTTILSAIAVAGGVMPTLRNPIVTLIRDANTYTIPAQELFASADKNTRLRGGDKILVEEDTRAFTALGASGLEDIIYFPKEHVNALEAVSLMGGINDTRADPQGILILREYAGAAKYAGHHDIKGGPSDDKVIFSIDLTSADGLFAARNFNVNPGDTIMATESPTTSLTTVLGVFGSVFGITTTVQAAAN
ncbi:polysaccharide biosynthesis/export family protein [Roseobacteraceae bacterium S113]